MAAVCRDFNAICWNVVTQTVTNFVEFYVYVTVHRNKFYRILRLCDRAS